MKVLYITNAPAPYRNVFFSQLGKKCDLTVLYERDVLKNRNKKWKAVTESTYKKIFLKGLKIHDENSINLEVIKYIDSSYDLILVGGYSTYTSMLAITYMRHKDLKFIINADGGFVNEKEGIIKRKLKEHFIKSADYWISTGKMTSKYLEYYGAKKEKTFIYPFSSVTQMDILKRPLKKEEKRAYKDKVNITTDKMILSVGQPIYRKGYDILLKACSNLLNDVTLCIVGGAISEELIKIKEEYKLKNIKFVEFNTKEGLSKYYKAADLFVLPTREDIWGLVVNEALANGLPVVTTNRCIAGLELLDNDTGRICEVNNVDDLNSVLKDFLNDKSVFSPENCLKIAQQYCIEEMVKRHIEIFNLILEKT